MDIGGLIPIIGAVAGGLIAVFIIFSIIMLRRVVPTNMVHIVQSSKKTTSYGKDRPAGNTYYQWPKWVPIFGVEVSAFPESIFDISLKNYEAYDTDRLPFVVDIKAFFRIEDSNAAAQRVSSFAELRTQLEAVLQGSVRRILATNHLETIMQDRSKLGAEFTEEVREQLTEWGVTPVKTVEFMDLKDSGESNVIHNIMAKEMSRIDMESRVKIADNEQAARQKEIESEQVIATRQQDAERAIGERTAEKEKAVGIADEQAKQEIAVQAKTTAEKEMDIKKVRDVRSAEIAKDVAAVSAEQDKQVKIIAANATKEQTVIEAEGKRQQTEIVAAGDLKQAQLNAEGVLAEGTSTAESKRLLELASIAGQISLAQEIGENVGYQEYLVKVRQIEASEEVGTHLAQAIGKADLKVIANAGDPQSGVAAIGDLFSAGGGTRMAGMLTALAQTPEGEALVSRLTGAKEEAPKPAPRRT